MTWFKLDDKSAFHSKVVRAGNASWGALCRAGAWSSEHLTDGRVPWAIALSIARQQVWDRAFSAGLCTEIDQHEFQIHDFLQWNPSREEVLRLRELRAGAGRTGGRRRQANAKQVLDQTPQQTPNNGQSKHQAKFNPDPDPDPDQKSRQIFVDPKPVCVSDRGNEKTNGTHTHGPKLDPETQAIRDRIASWPIFRELPADRLAYEHGGYMQSRGQLVAWILESIDSCARKCADGTTLQAKQSMLVSFMQRARKPRTDDSTEQRRPVAINHDDPVLRERVRKANEEATRRLDERIAREAARKKGEGK